MNTNLDNLNKLNKLNKLLKEQNYSFNSTRAKLIIDLTTQLRKDLTYSQKKLKNELKIKYDTKKAFEKAEINKQLKRLPSNNNFHKIITERPYNPPNISFYKFSKENRDSILPHSDISLLSNLPNNYKEDNAIKYMLNFHGSENIKNPNDTFQIPKNFYIISLEKCGFSYSSFIINYIYLKMGILNNISKEFFKVITNKLLALEIEKMHKLNEEGGSYIKNNIEQKNYKIYNSSNKFYNYKLGTEENDSFNSGLFKYPIKPYVVEQKIGGMKLPYENVLNLFQNNIKDILDSRFNKILPFIVNPMGKDKNKYYLFQKNDYYTMHCKYLNKVKEFASHNEEYSHDVNKYMKCLSDYITSNEKKIYLKDIVTFLRNKYPNKPIILILKACTYKNTAEYYQNNFLKNNYEQNEYYSNQRFNRNEGNEGNEDNREHGEHDVNEENEELNEFNNQDNKTHEGNEVNGELNELNNQENEENEENNTPYIIRQYPINEIDRIKTYVTTTKKINKITLKLIKYVINNYKTKKLLIFNKNLTSINIKFDENIATFGDFFNKFAYENIKDIMMYNNNEINYYIPKFIIFAIFRFFFNTNVEHQSNLKLIDCLLQNL